MVSCAKLTGRETGQCTRGMACRCARPGYFLGGDLHLKPVHEKIPSTYLVDYFRSDAACYSRALIILDGVAWQCFVSDDTEMPRARSILTRHLLELSASAED